MGETLQKDVPYLEITSELCKGCKLCIDVCPKSVIAISDELNSSSYHPAFTRGRIARAAACVSTHAPNRLQFASSNRDLSALRSWVMSRHS